MLAFLPKSQFEMPFTQRTKRNNENAQKLKNAEGNQRHPFFFSSSQHRETMAAAVPVGPGPLRPAIRQENDIPPNHFNNPDPTERLERLNAIGPLFSQRFENFQFRGQDVSIRTLQDFLDFIRTHSATRNREMMRQLLENPRWTNPATRCVGRKVYSNGCVYAVSQWNRYAWESLVRYARARLGARQRWDRRGGGRRDRIPGLLPKRLPLQAFPLACHRP